MEPEILDETEPETPGGFGLRVAGFLVVVLGVLLAGFGAIGTWVTVGAAGADLGDLTPTYLGTDLWQGKVVLGIALVTLLAVLLTRTGATPRIRSAAAGVTVACGFGILAIAGGTLILGTQGYIDDVVKAAGANGATQGLQDILSQALTATFGIGVWLTLAGGIVVLVGATLTLAWATRYRSGAEPGDAGFDEPS